MVNNVNNFVISVVLEKPIFRLTSVIFSGFSVILDYCITDVGFDYKNNRHFRLFSVNRPTTIANSSLMLKTPVIGNGIVE